MAVHDADLFAPLSVDVGDLAVEGQRDVALLGGRARPSGVPELALMAAVEVQIGGRQMREGCECPRFPDLGSQQLGDCVRRVRGTHLQIGGSLSVQLALGRGSSFTRGGGEALMHEGADQEDRDEAGQQDLQQELPEEAETNALSGRLCFQGSPRDVGRPAGCVGATLLKTGPKARQDQWSGRTNDGWPGTSISRIGCARGFSCRPPQAPP